MPTIDDFIRPKEWVPDVLTQMGKSLRRWGEENVVPVRQQIDEDWREHRLVKPLLKQVLVDLGVNSALFPQEVGGSDVPDPTAVACILGEELGRIDPGLATSCLCSVWGLTPMLLKPHRNMELCEEFGPKFCGEELYVGCHAMTEPAGGCDIENLRLGGNTIQTTATLDGEEWIVKGHKIWPTNSGGLADLYAVVATTKRGSTDPSDFATILVPADAEGVTAGNPYKKMGMAADMTSDIWFEEVRVPKRYRIHGPGEDFKYWRRCLSIGHMFTAALGVGIMKGVYEIIKKWTTDRVVAGKPLKEHGIVAEMLNEVAVNIESTSAWVWTYAREMDRSDIYGWEPWDERFFLKTQGIAFYGAKATERTCSRAMDFMGAYGYAREFNIEKYYRDQKIISLWMGGNTLRTIENTRYWFETETL